MRLLMKICLKISVVLGLICFGNVVKAQEIFVSPTGSNSGIGTADLPFATLHGAMGEVVKLRSTGQSNVITISLRGGIYRIQETLHLDSTFSDLIIRAYPGEKVIFSGGNQLPLHLLTLTNGMKGTLKQYRLDLNEAGIRDYGELRNVGFARPYGASWGELFVNNKPMNLSRWPNQGMVPLGKVLNKGSVSRNDDFSNRGGIITYDSTRIDLWSKENDAWMAGYFMWGFADDMVRIAGVDTSTNTIKTASATMYGFGYGEPWRQWYGVNIIAELDADGEYYVDRKNGILHFISNEKNIGSLEFSSLETPFIELNDCSNVILKGITFECSRGIGIAMHNTHGVTIQGCAFRNLGSLGIAMGKGIAPFKEHRHEGAGTAQPGIVGSLQQHLYQNSTFDSEAGAHNKIVGCLFYNLGAGGVILGGGNRLTLEKGHNVVENCVFHDLNRIEKSYRPAIHINGVGNAVRHCEIYNLPSMAIYLYFGNDNLVEYNYFHNVCLEVEDQGAFYYGRNPSEQGNVLRYNYFENIPDRYNTCAIYHDDGACGLLVYGNVFYRAGKWNVLIGGGSDNVYQNNIFIGNRWGIHVDNRLQNWGKALLEKGGVFDQRMAAVNYSQPPYSIHYPHLSTYFEMAALPSGNLVDNNVFVQVDQLLDGDKAWLDFKGTNLVLDRDPGFNGWSMQNFSLRPDSDIFKKMPGFNEIPFHKIGLQETVDLPTSRQSNGLRVGIKDESTK